MHSVSYSASCSVSCPYPTALHLSASRPNASVVSRLAWMPQESHHRLGYDRLLEFRPIQNYDPVFRVRFSVSRPNDFVASISRVRASHELVFVRYAPESHPTCVAFVASHQVFRCLCDRAFHPSVALLTVFSINWKIDTVLVRTSFTCSKVFHLLQHHSMSVSLSRPLSLPARIDRQSFGPNVRAFVGPTHFSMHLHWTTISLMCHLWISLEFSFSTANQKMRFIEIISDELLQIIHNGTYLALFAFEQLLSHNLRIRTGWNIGRFATWIYMQNRQKKEKYKFD